MSSKITWIVVGVVLIGGGLYFSYIQKNKQDLGINQPTESGETHVVVEEIQDRNTIATDSKKMPFTDFIKQGGSYECNVDQYVGNTTTKGVVYINNDLIRGDYKTNIQGVSVDTTMVVKDDYTYTWSSMLPNTGFKAKVAKNGQIDQNNTGTSASYSFNSEQIGDYDCKEWTPDMTMFELPSSITFQELN